MKWWFLMLAVIGLLLGADAPPKAPVKSNGKSREMVGYVVDVREPFKIVLTNRMGVPVNDRTRYSMETAQGRKKVARADVVVGQRVRITVGGNGVATRVVILKSPQAREPGPAPNRGPGSR